MIDQNRAAKVKAALDRSKKLIQLESNGSIDRIAKAHKDDINLSLDPASHITTESMVTTKRNNSLPITNFGSQMTAPSASNVPSVIRESFMKNPIDDSALYGAIGGDGRDISFLYEAQQPNKQVVSPSEIRSIVNEGMGGNVQQMSQNTSVDYPMIRTIVEDIVRKYTVSLKQKLLSENKQETNIVDTIMLGKGFKFLDSKGNIYECTMKKIGNLNDKKKKSIE